MNPSGGRRRLFEPDTEKAMHSYEKIREWQKNWAKFLQKMASLKLRAETKRWGWQLKLLRLTTKISDGAGAGAGCGHLGFRLGTGLKAGAPVFVMRYPNRV